MNVPPPLPEDLALALGAEYEIIGELGRGGVSVVYLARDRELGREVAIKVIRDAYASDGEAAARFEREARMLARLQHPSVVTLYAARRLPAGGLVLVMQYGQWKTLRAVLGDREPCSVSTVDLVLRDLTSALAYLHRHEVVHRDIKPENIFVDPEGGRALLSDFGLAKPEGGAENVTLAGVVIGTPAYMSPEQVDGRELDGRSDIYSLGMVGYEMLMGHHPWEGESLFNLIFKQKTERLPSLRSVRPDIPERLCQAIERAIAKDPSERWSDADSLLAHLTERAPAALLDVPAAAAAVVPLGSHADEMPTVEMSNFLAAAGPNAPPRRARGRKLSLIGASALLVLVAGIGAAAVSVVTRPVPRPLAQQRAPAAETPPMVVAFEPSIDATREMGLASLSEAEPTPLVEAPVPARRQNVDRTEAPAPRPAASRGNAADRETRPPRDADNAVDAGTRVQDTTLEVAASILGVSAQESEPTLSDGPNIRIQPTMAARAGSAPRSSLILEPASFTPRMSVPQLRNEPAVAQALVSAYPQKLRRAGIGGTVQVWVLVDTRGNPVRSRIVGSSGIPELDAAAMDVAATMRFTPGLSQGLPTETSVRIPVRFQPGIRD